MTQAYLYKWTELSTNKWYIGSRTRRGCHVNDGYICSSKHVKPLIESNSDNWKRIVLVIGEPKYIRNLESKYLILLNARYDPMSYNLHNGDGNFSFVGFSHSIENRTRMSSKRKGIPKTEKQKLCSKLTHLGRKRPISTKQKLQQAAKSRLIIIVKCPHCDKQGEYKNMKRWHFDKCKYWDGKGVIRQYKKVIDK